jgi:hypothetical protein
MLFKIDPDPLVSELQEKYHWPQVAAITKIKQLMKNALSQR